MAANTTAIFPKTPVVGIATLTSATAITSRANITGTTGLVQLTATATEGTRVDAITITGKGSTVASVLDIWLYNGTTSFYLTSMNIDLTTASTTVAPFTATRTFTTLGVPLGSSQIFVSQTIQTDVNVFAFGGVY